MDVKQKIKALKQKNKRLSDLTFAEQKEIVIAAREVFLRQLKLESPYEEFINTLDELDNNGRNDIGIIKRKLVKNLCDRLQAFYDRREEAGHD